MGLKSLVNNVKKKTKKTLQFGGAKTIERKGEELGETEAGDVRVAFSLDNNEVHSVLKRRSQFSRESLAAIWFEGEDFEDFIDDARKTIDKMERGKEFKDKKYTTLGLESLTEEGMALKQGSRNDAWDAVMWEQEYQFRDGARSSVKLARAYQDVSRDSEMRAVHVALKLHKEVIKYLTSDDIDVQKSKHKKKKLKRRSSFNF